MGKKRVISSKSIGSKSGGKSFFASKVAKLGLASLVILVVASFIPAVSREVKNINMGMEASNLRKQIEEQKAERRRLIALKAEAMSPEQISKAASRLGFIPMSARNIKGYEVTSDSAASRSARSMRGGLRAAGGCDAMWRFLSAGVRAGPVPSPRRARPSARRKHRPAGQAGSGG